MKPVSRLLRSILLLAGSAASLTAAEPVPTIIVLDASGSMRERIRSETKMEIAKRAIRDLVGGLPEGASVGLVVYSHRKSNDCDDIEQLIVPGKLDRAAFIAAVDAIKPNGRTPLSGALEFTAAKLDYAHQPANIILLSDGVETCGKDPCATIARLTASANRLVVHAVAFDLSAREAKSFECIAAATGGRFLQAADAASLKDALSVAVAETVAVPNAGPPTPPPAEVLSEAKLQVPPTVLAGAEFPVGWSGPNNSGDYVTIVPKGTPDDIYVNFAYTRSGTPVAVTALVDPGDAEVRYVTGRSRKILARAPIKITAAEVTLAAAEKATAGARVEVTWTGPNNHGDYITIVPKHTEDGGYARYSDTHEGSTLRILAPMELGEAEIRYMSGQGRRVLARRPLQIIAAEVTLNARDEIVAGGNVEVTWTGPGNEGDYITVVMQGARDESYEGYKVARENPVTVKTPITAGAAEIRYVAGQGHTVLARRPLKLVAAEVTLSAVDEVVAGGNVEVTWTGPNNDGDNITIVMQGARDDSYEGYAYTKLGSTVRVKTPITAGAAEIRYVTGQGRKVLARRPLRLKAVEVTLAAPEAVVAGAEVEIVWTGPNNDGDYLTIVPQAMKEDGYAAYKYTSLGSPLKIAAPIEPGACEIRYVSGKGRKVFARRSLNVRAAEVMLRAPAKAVLGTQVSVEWTGPNNKGDHLTIVPKGTPEGRAERTAMTSRGSPALVGTPKAPGPCELRYVSGQGGRTLARVDIEITPVGTSP